MQISTIYYGVGIVGAGGTVLYKVAKFFLGMDFNIKTILTNHLPHIDARLNLIEEHLFERTNPSSNARRDREDRSEG